jgi:THUMP domain-like/RNA cap guanine-N2 methyltransferase
MRQATQAVPSEQRDVTCCGELADYHWLTGAEAADVLAEFDGRDEPLHVVAKRLRTKLSAARTHLLLDQLELRQRGTAKFARASQMFFTRLGLEQATDQWVAQYKAGRFVSLARRGPLADLCCGLGGDLVALAGIASTIGVDRDPLAACFAAANARIAEVADRVTLQICDVDSLAAGEFAAWHIDPDRRPSGQRTTALDWSSPGVDSVERLLAASPHAAIKLAPAADAPPAWSDRCELEWISRDRQCRQLVAWHGELAQTPGERRATVLSADGAAMRSVSGRADQSLKFSVDLDQYLFEPDPAVLAARLTGVLAAEHDLSAFAAGVAYLTGPCPIDDPALSCFAVEEVMPFDLRRIAGHLRQRGIGRLEIKKRGVEHDPESIRKQLQLLGENSATLFLTKLNGKHTAILARRSLNSQP